MPPPTAVVQILAADGESVAGAGLLAHTTDKGKPVVLTCAHVVRAAGCQGPGGTVDLAFPHVPEAPRVRGHVPAAGWREPDAEDVAVVRLEPGDVRAGVEPLSLGTAAGSRGHAVRSFGFPDQAPPGGHYGYAEAGDVIPPTSNAATGPLLQLTKANELTTGFSGAPVIDEKTGGVIGMVTSFSRPDEHLRGLTAAYATPAEVLREIWSALTEAKVSPYRGLDAFTADDARWFHGRGAAETAVLTALRGQRRVLLLGPSGSGKSSLVQAGVLPKLAAGEVDGLPGTKQWLQVVARPGTDGANLLVELDHVGLPGATTDGILPAVQRRLAREPNYDRVLLVIDQLEALISRPDANAMLEHLVAAAGATTTVSPILVMRNDFYPRLAASARELLETMRPCTVDVPATLDENELRAIITKPATTAGARFEDNLPDRIISDLLDTDPAGPTTRQAPVTILPLLEVALTQMWEKHQNGTLTHRSYDRVGKVTGSLATWCDAALNALPPGKSSLVAERILTALIQPGDDAQNTPPIRRQVTLDDLRAQAALPSDDDGALFDAVLSTITHPHHRIIATRTPSDDSTQPIAELIHDALIRDWPQLRHWVAADREFQHWLQRARAQNERWSRSRNSGDLMSGTDLDAGLAWSRERGLPRNIATFLNTSRQHQQAAIRRTRRLNAVLASLLALALIAAGLAFWQRQAAIGARQEAITAQEVAESRQLAAQSTALLDTDPELASLLAVQAYRTEATPEATLSLYAAAAIPLRHRLVSHDGILGSVTFSPDGHTLATASSDGTARLWDVETGMTREVVEDFVGSAASVAFSPDGKTLATASGGQVRLLDLDTGHVRNLTDQVEATGPVAFSPDGRTLATGSSTGPALLWNVAEGTSRRVITSDAADVRTLAFSPDSDTLVTATHHGDVQLWDVNSGELRHTLAGRGTAVAFSPDGRTLATASTGLSVRLWDVGSGELRATLRGLSRTTVSLAFSPDGRTLAAGGYDGKVRLWEVATGNIQHTLTAYAEVGRLAFSPDGRTLAAGSEEGTVRLWEVASGAARETLTTDAEGVSIAFSPDSRTLATASTDFPVRLWDVASGEARESLGNGLTGASSVAFSPDGRTLATDGYYGTVDLWDTATGEILDSFISQGESVTSLAFSPDGRTLATGSGDGAVHMWDMATGEIRETFTGDNDGLGSISFSPDGRTLATVQWDGTVRLWDVDAGEIRRTLPRHISGVVTVAFSPDSRTLATTSDGLPVRLWDVATGEIQETLASPTDGVASVAFSSDGATLATADGEGTVRLWDVATGETRQTLTGHTEGVRWVAFSPDGRTIASSSYDRTVRLWDVSLPGPEEAISQICHAVHRDFTQQERSSYLPDQPDNSVCLS